MPVQLNPTAGWAGLSVCWKQDRFRGAGIPISGPKPGNEFHETVAPATHLSTVLATFLSLWFNAIAKSKTSYRKKKDIWIYGSRESVHNGRKIQQHAVKTECWPITFLYSHRKQSEWIVERDCKSKSSVTSPNSVANWGPGVQIPTGVFFIEIHHTSSPAELLFSFTTIVWGRNHNLYFIDGKY